MNFIQSQKNGGDCQHQAQTNQKLHLSFEFIEVSRNLTMSHKANREPLPNQEVDDANERIIERN
jgi:hypothetical protein